MIVRVADATRMQCGRYNGMCRGPACMQFRVMVPGTVAGAEEREQTGSCGLGGMPTVKALHVPKAAGQRGIPEVEPHALKLQKVMTVNLKDGTVTNHRTGEVRSVEPRIHHIVKGGISPSEASMPGVPDLPCGECAGDDCPGCVGG